MEKPPRQEFPADRDARGGLRLALAACAIALLAAAPYLIAGPSASFIAFDDDRYIYENPQVRQGLNGATVRWALTSTENANWYPLRRLSHLVDVSLFGLDARGHHAVSVLWHAAAAVLLLLALLTLTGAARRSFVVAALFAVHPVQVESVAWAAERSNVLAGFCFALALLLFARHARRPGPGRYGAFLLAGALGLGAKATLLGLPLVLLLLDFWPLARLAPAGAPPWRVGRRGLRRCLLEVAPLLAMGAAAGLVAALAHRLAGALPETAAQPLVARLGTAALSGARYLGTLLWPADLAVFYPHPWKPPPAGEALAAALLLTALTALALATWRRRPWLATGWLWFAGMLAPTLGLVPFGLAAMADRFLYLPATGLFLAVVWAVGQAAASRPRARALLAPAAAAALLALAGASVVQAGYWRDSETLFRRALAVTRDNWVIHNNLAGVLARQGRHREAVAEAREAVRLRPEHPATRESLGAALAEEATALTRDGRLGEAVAAAREAVSWRPGFAPAYDALGEALAAQGHLEASLFCLREAIRLDPGDPRYRRREGDLLARLGRRGEAAAAYREARRLDLQGISRARSGP